MLKGLIYCLLANFLFGVVYYFAILLRPLSGESMFGFRIVVLTPFVLLAILLFKQQDEMRKLLQKIKQKPPLILIILLLSLNTGVQLWLFLYAPNHGHSIPVSIGYLLLPIIAVILGKIVFNEYLSPLKWLSILFAALGVSINIFSSATISWATFVAGLGYPVYITLRRYFEINTLSTLLVELLIVLPFALYFIAQIDLPQITNINPNLYIYLALLGLINGIAIFLYITSSNLLPVNVFGLLGYVEPLMMLVISLIIGETLNLSAYILMICLAISIALLTLESFKKSKHSI